MGVVAPISAAAAVIPFAVGLARGERPWPPAPRRGVALGRRRAGLAEPGALGGGLAAGVGLALLAAAGFGSYFVFIDVAATTASPGACSSRA